MKMTKNTLNARKERTRTLIQLGGLVQKSGLMDILNIQVGDDLQDHGNLSKTSQILGFLQENLENSDITETVINRWEKNRRTLVAI